MMAEVKWLILFGVACYGFGALSVTADELYGIAQFCGTVGDYYFPIIGARGLWDAWVYVFTGLGLCVFLCTLSVLMLQRTKATRKEASDPIQSERKIPVQRLGV